jgi:hypothetical protein
VPLIRYVHPRVLSTTVETMAEAYGLRLTVRDWETSFTDIKIVGRDVEIVTAGPYREKRLFRANAVEFDWSLVRALSGAYTRLTTCWTAVIGRECTLPEEVFHRVSIDGATLHLERSLAGAWNTGMRSDRIARHLVARGGAGAHPATTARGRSVVVNMPGELAAGSSSSASSMDFTKVTLSLAQLQVPVDERENGTRFTSTVNGPAVSVAG